MPSSYWGFISDVIDVYQEKKPRTVLDVGVGFGKWGHLFREYSEVYNHDIWRENWMHRIDGIEIFEKYVTVFSHQKSLYDNIYIGDAFELIDQLISYDFIIAADVIEHFEKEKAKVFIEKLKNKSATLVITIPMHPTFTQGETFGNIHESHKSFWDASDTRWKANRDDCL